MPLLSDWQLLENYVAGDRAAMEVLVHRHIQMVYATACRLVSSVEADDVTQTVFLLLTRKARSISPRESLAGWLHRATRLCAANLRKREGRYRRRIQEAAMQIATTAARSDQPGTQTQWLELLDLALSRLKEPERAVLLIHHLQQQSIENTALQLGITPDAAQKRAARGLERLRNYFARHGQNIPAASVLAAGLNTAATSAPAPAAATIQSVVSITHGAPAAAHLAALAKASAWSVSAAPKIAAATAIAASLVIATTLTAMTYAHSIPAKTIARPSSVSPVSASALAATTPSEIVTTAPASPAFKGWVHYTFQNASTKVTYGPQSINTVTSATLDVEKSPNDMQITYRNPATGDYLDYHSSTNLIRIGLFNPERKEDMAERAAELPLNYAAVIGRLRPLLGHEPTGVTHTLDQGLDRYDFSAPREEAKKVLQTQGNDANAANSDLFDIASVIWVDPSTHLTQRAQINNGMNTYTYGGPDIASIYDAGAPKAAKIYDNRPTPQTLAVLDRIQKRSTTPLPDGVSVTWGQYEFETNLLVYEQSKNHWIQRTYSIHPPHPDGYTLDLPADWATTGADEFFRRLAITPAHDEFIGSDTDVYIRDFTPRAPADTQPKIYPDGSSYTVITQRHDTGRDAKGSMWIGSPQWFLFTTRIAGQYSTANHASLVTDPDRPGLIGIRNELRRDTPDSIRAYDEYWIDPAHAERIVQHIDESFEDPPSNPQQSAIISSSGEFKSITDYSDFVTLPDGRQYATVAATTNYEPQSPGQYATTSTTKTIFHFFPNRTLPPLVIPTTQPATPSPNLP